MTKKRIWIIVSILLVLNLCITGFLCIEIFQSKNQKDAQVKYVLYIGTNDKDTNKPVYSSEEAIKIINDICIQYISGFTLQEATGYWTQNPNNVVTEKTILCIINDVDDATVHKIANEIRISMNQECILIEKSNVQIDFYEGESE